MDRAKILNTDKHIPASLKNQGSWLHSRRKFVKSMILAGISTQIPLLQSCFNNDEEISAILSKSELAIVRDVQDILFPTDQYGPGALELQADKYLLWVISDTRFDPEEQQYIINGIGWVDETAEEVHSKKYESLNLEQKKYLIEIISKEDWGKSWLSALLTFIFEAMFADPLYGSNPNGIGWKWLDYNPGNPKPEAELIYDNILRTHKK
jgi:gluconate 2-dehydrogenase gamma chain